MKLAKQQELERQSRRHIGKKTSTKQQKSTARSGKHRRRHGAAAGEGGEEQEEDVPVLHVVSTTVDVPEVCSSGL